MSHVLFARWVHHDRPGSPEAPTGTAGLHWDVRTTCIGTFSSDGTCS
eukprot:SAG22_NODE_16608_length_321_cov_1.450450_1_plen_46_part_01